MLIPQEPFLTKHASLEHYLMIFDFIHTNLMRIPMEWNTTITVVSTVFVYHTPFKSYVRLKSEKPYLQNKGKNILM